MGNKTHLKCLINFDFDLRVLFRCVLGEIGSTPIKLKFKIKHIFNIIGLKT